MAKRGRSSKPSLRQPETQRPGPKTQTRPKQGPPLLGFNRMESDFFLAANRVSLSAVQEEPAPAPVVIPVRRAALRVVAGVVFAAALALAWQGPGKAFVPRAWAHVALERPAQGHVLAQVTSLCRASDANTVSAPAALSPETSAIRSKPHPATATRTRHR